MPSGPRSAGLRAPGIPRRKGRAEWVPPGPPLVTPLAWPLSDKWPLIRPCPCRPPPSASLQPGATSLRAVAPGFRSALHNRGLCKLHRPTTAHTRRPRLRRGRPALGFFLQSMFPVARKPGAPVPLPPRAARGRPPEKYFPQPLLSGDYSMTEDFPGRGPSSMAGLDSPKTLSTGPFRPFSCYHPSIQFSALIRSSSANLGEPQ